MQVELYYRTVRFQCRRKNWRNKDSSHIYCFMWIHNELNASTDRPSRRECYILLIAIWFARAHISLMAIYQICTSRVSCCGKSNARITEEPAAVCVYYPHATLNAHNFINPRKEEFRRISRKRHTSFPCWSIRHADYSAALVESPSSRRMVRRPERWAIRISHSSYRIRSHGPVSA